MVMLEDAGRPEVDMAAGPARLFDRASNLFRDLFRELANKLKDEIRQKKPFKGLEQEALLNIRRTSGYVEHVTQQILKDKGLTDSQYNVLRILRGAEPDGLSCSGIGERMITRDPDITRLLSRLQRRGLVGRRRDTRDRRVIHIRISAAGSAVLEELDPVVEANAVSVLGHLAPEKLALLIDLLEDVRGRQCEQATKNLPEIGGCARAEA